MNAALAVFRLEVKERSRVLVVALAMAAIPFLIAVAPALEGQRKQAIGAAGVWLALIYAFSIAFVVGSSTLGRALAEKRMSFYLAKPLSAAATWFGKLGAGLAMSYSVAAIILIPALLIAPDGAREHLDVVGQGFVVVLVVGVPLLFLLGNLLSTFIRSRSLRLAFDFVCLLLTAGAIAYAVRPMLVGGAIEATGKSLAACGLAILLVMGIAPVWQVARGRALVRDSHAALSNAVWAGVAVVVIALAGFSFWVTRAPFESIGTFSSVQSSDGRFVLVGGESARAGYHVTYLVDTASGEKRRLSGVVPWASSEISADGRTLVTMRLGEFLPKTGATELVFTPLRDGGVRGIVRTSEWTGRYAINEDASRLVVATKSGLTAYEPATGTMLASARIDGRGLASLFFASPNVVRVIKHRRAGETEHEIHELDIVRRTARRTGGFAARGGFAVASHDGERMILMVEDRVVDGQTGETVMQLADSEDIFGTMLRDGRIAAVTRGTEHSVLRVFGTDGTPTHAIELPAARASVVGQVGTSKLLLRSSDSMVLVDLERNAVVYERKGARLSPSYVDHRLMSFPEDGSVLGMDAEKELAMWKVATGEKRAL